MLTNAPPVRYTTEKPHIQIDETKEFGIEEPKVQSSEQKISTISQNETKIEMTTNGSNSSSHETEEAKVNIPMEIVYMLLIGE